MNTLSIRPDGTIEALALGGFSIPFRTDDHAGPALYRTVAGEPHRIRLFGAQGVFTAEEDGVAYRLQIAPAAGAPCPDTLGITVTVENRRPDAVTFERLSLKLGTDAYMVSYPQWNDCLFPTLLRCEKTHFTGYLQTPLGHALAIASPDPIASWSCDYNKVIGGDETHVGHRIYTVNLDLWNAAPHPVRHPDLPPQLTAGDVRVFHIFLCSAAEDSAAYRTACRLAGAPLLTSAKYTYEPHEPFQVTGEGTLSITDSEGRAAATEGPHAPGVYTVRAQHDGKVTEMLVHVRHPYTLYLQKAREAALRYPQKATTHTESWYGFFSAFLARRHCPDPALDDRLLAEFTRIYTLLYDENDRPTPAFLPWRIQNSAAMVSLLTDLYEATGDRRALERACRIADGVLLPAQKEDGAYYCHDIHYTCVIYPAKSLLELSAAEEAAARDDGAWAAHSRRHFDSARRAVENLYHLRDNIQTEGEQTFEDGMLTCEALQLGAYALTLADPAARAAYAGAAAEILAKHRCLEQRQVPDCRMRGATLRFWEAMYDVCVESNMFNSPHGWTGWKLYASYYLYLLTGEAAYLLDTMDTLGACLQLLDIPSGDLRWAFLVDPCVPAHVWTRREPDPVYGEADGHYGTTRRRVLGEQYYPMISDWFIAPEDRVVFGYPLVSMGRVDGMYQGGCCDNDVHEIFKALAEVALDKCYVHAFADGRPPLVYNATLTYVDGVCHVTPAEAVIRTCYGCFPADTQVCVHFADGDRQGVCTRQPTAIHLG